jgi:hypothetical protein
MRNLLALVGLALVVVGGLGWYLGWYKIKSGPADASGHRKVEFDIDTKKFGNDVHNGEEHIQKWLDNGKGDPAKGGKEPPGKSGAVRVPDPTGFPFDAPGPQSGAANVLGPVLQTTPDDAPVPGAFFNKKSDTPSADTFSAPVGSYR